MTKNLFCGTIVEYKSLKLIEVNRSNTTEVLKLFSYHANIDNGFHNVYVPDEHHLNFILFHHSTIFHTYETPNMYYYHNHHTNKMTSLKMIHI